jgi:hypothetical protein
VVIDTDAERLLAGVLHDWGREVGGLTELPDGLAELRHALVDDFADTGEQR